MSLKFWIAVEVNEPSDRDGVERIPKIVMVVMGMMMRKLVEGEIEFSQDEDQRLLRPYEHVFVEPDVDAKPLLDGSQPSLAQASIRLFRPDHYPPVAPDENLG